MSGPYIGEIRMFAGNFAPAGWAFCQGQLIPISENEALFNLIGTTYGGDGQSTFAYPDLRSRVPIHQGTGSTGTPYTLAETGGAETVTLNLNQIPSHSHAPQGNTAGGTASGPSGQVWASSALDLYSSAAPSVTMNAAACGSTGGSQPHDNMMPFLAINFILSLYGVFPSPT